MEKSPGKGKVGQIECLVCGDYFWYNTTQHQRTHPPDMPQDYYDYKDYVKEEFNLNDDSELLDGDTVINPNMWDEVKDEYPDVEIGLKYK